MFLYTAADAVIRSDVSHDTFISRVHELSAAHEAQPEERWMSALLGEDRTIHCDPATGEIIQDDENKRLYWSREYRQGWEPKVF